MFSKSLANKKKFETDCLSNKTVIWIHWYIYLSLRNYMELNDCCRFDHCSICSAYVLAFHFVYLIVTFLLHVNFFFCYSISRYIYAISYFATVKLCCVPNLYFFYLCYSTGEIHFLFSLVFDIHIYFSKFLWLF